MSIIGSEWIQAGELGLAFIVVVLCAGLITFVMKTSARREQELMGVITQVLPMMEALVSSTTAITNGIGVINLRLESIEDNQMLLWKHKAPSRIGAWCSPR